MRYENAHYLAAASYSKADHAVTCAYFARCAHAFTGASLRIEGVAHSDGIGITKYRRQAYSEEKIGHFVDQAIAEESRSLGIYISTADFTDDCAPAFQANLHVSFRDTFAAKDIAEKPKAFFIAAVRLDQGCVSDLRNMLSSPVPGLLRGGIWECRYYEDHGAAIVWAYKNYPIPRTRCSLSDWKPGFDLEFTEEPNQPPQTTPLKRRV